MEKEEKNIVVTGVGGQGNILASRVISTAAVKSGFSVRGAETLGAAQRGGHVISQIRLGPKAFSPVIPQNSAHVLLALEPVEALRVSHLISPDCLVIVNTKSIMPPGVHVGKEKYPEEEEILQYLKCLTSSVYSFNAVDLATKAGDPRTMNIVMVGALAATTNVPLATDVLRETIKELVPMGTETVNMKAFDLGFETVRKMVEKRSSVRGRA
jgi:indolepyruvate ferredoxin oxidoreductase beta subunit